MKISRVLLVTTFFVSALALTSISPPAGALLADPEVEILTSGYDVTGNDCADPVTSIAVPSGTAVDVCFTIKATVQEDGFAITELAFGSYTGGLSDFSKDWSENIPNELQTVTRSGSLSVPDGDVNFGQRRYIASVTMVRVGEIADGSINAATPDSSSDTDSVYLNLDLEAPTLTKTVSTDGTCGTESTATVLTNTLITYCYSIVNPSSTATIHLASIYDNILGSLTGDQEIYPGTTFTDFESASMSATVTNVATACVYWYQSSPQTDITATNTAIFQEPQFCEDDVITATATVTVEDPNPSIAVAATVGTTDGVCATETNIAVDLGTDVFFCYTATNDGNVPLDMHTVADTLNGTLLTDKAHDLAPGDSVTSVALGATSSTAVTGDITNTVTWTATGETPELPLEDKLVASATVTAEATADAGVTANPEVLDELAFTGNETGPLTIAGIAALFAGIILLAATRRREN